MDSALKSASAAQEIAPRDSSEDIEDVSLSMEGIDQEGDEAENACLSDAGDEGQDNEDDLLEDDESIVDEDGDDTEQLEEAERERRELLLKATADTNGRASAAAVSNNSAATSLVDSGQRLEYLLAQSEVFAHFLAGSVATDANASNGKKSDRGGKKGRLTESEEDAQLLKSAQSKRQVVRLDKQPSILAPCCTMHPYQLEGLNWMIRLHDHGLNGILADEMGLGKTLQTISLLAYLRESRGVRGPHLVVVPKSVVGNWVRELKKWCPCIRVVRMNASKDERKVVVEEELKKLMLSKKLKNDSHADLPTNGSQHAKSTTPTNSPSKVAVDTPGGSTTKHKNMDVLVTTYEGVLKEKGVLCKIPWKYLIIDEAHRIKNENSSLSKTVRLLTAQFRLLITGTPLQNNLHELWALLNFLLPDIFGNAEQFDEWFNTTDAEGQQNVIRKLHTVLNPFMIRRVKKDVARSLPPKKETKLYIGLTPMQQEWYKRVLRKDAHELNSLGGPDRVRLLNIIMQLRKVTNHPYLFDGAEPGPPFMDGPHLWENSGKMMLLHKLLPKLKQNGSRVLIFSQMTRMLDILEDYLRLLSLEYCRIDGNTEGEVRDAMMDEFNKDGSTKFCFLLSTRAGGLGINLATADIVILYDSDWNPQVDLQAMDRAHRIGQTKPVQVFRFITEGTIEEKIIERADRKLFLDAAVIQQGRLAEQNSAVGKDDLMKMVRFGADEILSGKGGSYTDEDIDALILRGEERTSAMQAKLETNAQYNLASFSLLGNDDTARDTFSFDGENYRDADKKGFGNFINLPQRERKRLIHDVNDPAVSGSNANRSQVIADAKKRKKSPTYQDFQLFDNDRLDYFNKRISDLASVKEQEMEKIASIRLKAKHAPSVHNSRSNPDPGESAEELNELADRMEKSLDRFDLSQDEEAEQNLLMSEGFPDWSRKDFKVFTSSLEEHGRYDIKSIVEDVTEKCGKSEAEVKRYFVRFFANYQRINDWKKIIQKIERGELKIIRLRQIRSVISEKIERHLLDYTDKTLIHKGSAENPANTSQYSSMQVLEHTWPSMTLNYGTAGKKSYTEEEDAFLIFMMYKHGYLNNERIRLEIRRAPQFRFDWYFKSRNSQEIQKRCEFIVRLLEKELEETKKKEEADEKYRDLDEGMLMKGVK